MKKILLLIITTFILFTYDVKAKPINSNFDDDSFYSCVIDNLNEENINGISDRDATTYNVTDDELTKLPTLTCISYEITSIKGIEKLTGVTYIDFQDNNISFIDLSQNINLIYIFVDSDVDIQGYEGTIDRGDELLQNTGENHNQNLIIFISIIGIFYLIMTVELYILFIRLNEKGWKALIPIYNNFILTKITNQSILYFILSLIPIANIFVLYKIGIVLTEKFNKGKPLAILFAILPFVSLIFLLAKKKVNYNNVSMPIIEEQGEENIPNVKIESEPLGVIDDNTSVMTSLNNEINPQVEIMNQQNNLEQSTNKDLSDVVDLSKPETMKKNNINVSTQENITNNQITNDMEYKICSKCGNKLRSDAQVCFMCGNKLN